MHRPDDRRGTGASTYAALLAAGPGGAYVALSGTDLEAVAGAATRLGPGWGAAADPDSILNHRNGVHSLHQAWVEGGQRLESLLQTLGAVPCGSVQIPDGRQGREWGLAAGSLVVLRPRSTGTQSRPVGVVLATSSQAVPAPVEAMPGLWIAFVQSVAATAN
jgi:hypothetical protein